MQQAIRKRIVEHRRDGLGGVAAVRDVHDIVHAAADELLHAADLCERRYAVANMQPP